MKQLIIAILILIPAYAFAEEWVLVSEGESGSKVYVDKSSIQKSKNNTKAKVKQTFATDLISENNKSKYNELRVLYLFNCKESKLAVLEGKKINSDGDIVRSDKFEDLTWVPAKPDTVINYAMEYSCNYTE